VLLPSEKGEFIAYNLGDSLVTLIPARDPEAPPAKED
jgi:hypothetical protein